VDTGVDRIVDFNPAEDVVDLSALFWGMTGDARDYVQVRLDSNFSTAIPTIDSVLLVQRPEGSVQEIVLEGEVVGAAQLVQLIVEGGIRMGGLGIPTDVGVALAPGSVLGAILESNGRGFAIEVTRSGAGVAGALEVPLGFLADALGRELLLDGATEVDGQRAVVSFARGEIRKTLMVRPLPDLDAEGAEMWQVAVLPSHQYAVTGKAVEQVVQDAPNVWLEVVEGSVVAGTAQPGVLRIHRDGDLTSELVLDLRLGGTAQEGVHIGDVPRSVTIPAGTAGHTVAIHGLPEGLAAGPKMVVLELVAREEYLVGNPYEAVLYAGITPVEASGAGFDRWLAASTGGELVSLADLRALNPDLVQPALEAYAFGTDPTVALGASPLSIRIVDGRPEIIVKGAASPSAVADVRWRVETAASLGEWQSPDAPFVEVSDPEGLKLVGPPLTEGERVQFYRLNLRLESGQLAGSTLTALAGTSRFGISGEVRWLTDVATGDLVSGAGPTGESGRIIAEVDGAATLRFEMDIQAAGPGDLLTFYVDGMRVAQTAGGSQPVVKTLDGNGPHLLVWEFQRGNGQAVIRQLAL
jgi:hypothetical protein